MRTYRFDVTFNEGPSITVWALNEEAAQILAQARRIEAGLDYKVVSVQYKEGN